MQSFRREACYYRQCPHTDETNGMRACAYRQVALVLLLPLGIEVATVHAGLVADPIDVANFDDAVALGPLNSPALGINLPTIGVKLNITPYTEPALIDGGSVGGVFTIVPEGRSGPTTLSNPFAQHSLALSTAALLAKSWLETEPEWVGGYYPVSIVSITTSGLRQNALAGKGTTSFFVPEPTVLLLLAAGIPAIIGRRPRRRQ